MIRMRCPECGEPVEQGRPRGSLTGYALNVDARRLAWRHLDRSPLCPVMTSKGYQPALPRR